MKTKGKYREVRHPITGVLRPSKYPVTREEAIQENVVKYWPQEPCPIHFKTGEVDGREPVVYTKTGIRGCCAIRNAIDEYNAAVRRGEPTSIHQAREMELNFYWSPIENKQCGHPGKTLLNGKCYTCEGEKLATPRQVAIAKGEAWYTPAFGDECKRCGTLSRRRTGNGSCEECERRGAAARPKEFHELYPDYVIDRHTARGLGFKVFRTGKPCRNGHTGWRYVSTGNCIDCIQGVKNENVSK